MALKDTLKQLQSGKADQFDGRSVVAEWQKAVTVLFDEIQTFLREYKNEGTITFELEPPRQATEEALGSYDISDMILRAGPAVVVFQPVGRMLVAATGRVDMFRQGRSAEDERAILLRSSQPFDWHIAGPPKKRRLYSRSFETDRQYVPLTQEVLEAILDDLLKQLPSL